MDMGTIYRDVTRTAVPQATICFDPFHVIKWANEALEAVYRATPASAPLAVPGITPRRAWKRTRFTLRVAAEKHQPVDAKILAHLRRHQWRVFRAWQLKEALRELYQGVHPDVAGAYLRRWCSSAARSRINAFVTLARRIRRNFDGIIAAVELGLSNSRLEAINGRIRLIQRRGYGLTNLQSLTAMIHLCLGGITITLPTER